MDLKPYFLAMVTLVAACQTAPQERRLYDGEAYIHARWPIHSFQNYDPYPSAESAVIDAFVDFGGRDGLMRFSLGCGTFAMPFEITETARLTRPGDTSIIAPDLDKQACSDRLKTLSLELAQFMGSEPSIGYEADHMLTLRTEETVLELNSVEYVLAN